MLERKDFPATWIIPDDEADHEIDTDSPITQRESKLIADAFRKADQVSITVKSIEC